VHAARRRARMHPCARTCAVPRMRKTSRGRDPRVCVCARVCTRACVRVRASRLTLCFFLFFADAESSFARVAARRECECDDDVRCATARRQRARKRRRWRARDALARAAIVDATRAARCESHEYACVECVVAGRRRCGRGGAEKGENGYAASIAMRCDAMRCDAMRRVFCVCVSRCDGAVALCLGAVCARDMYVCVCARASGVGGVRRSSSGGARDARATQRG